MLHSRHTLLSPVRVLSQTVSAILSRGRRLAAEERSPCPLMFTWHDKHYLGAAHGLCGILALLMQVNRTS